MNQDKRQEIDDEKLSDAQLDTVSGGKTVVSGGVLNRKAISLPKPAYPPIA